MICLDFWIKKSLDEADNKRFWLNIACVFTCHLNIYLRMLNFFHFYLLWRLVCRCWSISQWRHREIVVDINALKYTHLIFKDLLLFLITFYQHFVLLAELTVCIYPEKGRSCIPVYAFCLWPWWRLDFFNWDLLCSLLTWGTSRLSFSFL